MNVFFSNELESPIVDSLALQFEELSKKFSKEAHLLNTNAAELFESFINNEAVVVLSGDMKIVGYTRITFLCIKGRHSWYELGGSWVDPTYRGHSLCLKMYKKLFSIHEENKCILATTTSAYAVEVGKKLEFLTVPRKKLPKEVWSASCVCSSVKTKVSCGMQHLCKRAHGEPQVDIGLDPCLFRVTKRTGEVLGYI